MVLFSLVMVLLTQRCENQREREGGREGERGIGL
jgi:hypothetical protein